MPGGFRRVYSPRQARVLEGGHPEEGSYPVGHRAGLVAVSKYLCTVFEIVTYHSKGCQSEIVIVLVAEQDDGEPVRDGWQGRVGKGMSGCMVCKYTGGGEA